MKWISAFKYLSVNFASEVAKFHNQTQRVCFDANLNGVSGSAFSTALQKILLT